MHNPITPDIIESIEASVLCWLSTISEDGFPNVSPKEAFTHDGAGKLLVANIASPQTVRNIERNPRVCVSFINVFVQKGYKIKGNARVLKPDHPTYAAQKRHLTDKIGSTFPIISVIEIDPTLIEEIIAPSYRLFPNTGPLDRIKESVRTYKVAEYLKQTYPAEMNPQPPHDIFALLTGGAELLDRVEPLWSQLRRHHAELSPRWSATLLASSFEQRRAGLLQKAAGGLLVSLATSRGLDVGYCVSTITADATGEVDSLYVIPSHRARGIGHALMSTAMDWFARQPLQSIIVDVISGNDAAQRFYVRYGFHPRTVRLLRPSGGVA